MPDYAAPPVAALTSLRSARYGSIARFRQLVQCLDSFRVQLQSTRLRPRTLSRFSWLRLLIRAVHRAKAD